MANKDNPAGFKVHSCIFPSIPTYQGILKSGVTVTATDNGADMLAFSTDGYLDIATATSTAIVGIAKFTLTGDGTKILDYVPALPGILFEGQCSGTLTQTMLNTSHDIEGTTGIMEINEDAASTNVVLPLYIQKNISTGLAENALGANARVVFKIFKSALISQ